jgi:hypothetical protein
MRVALGYACASVVCLVLAVSPLSAADITRYREFTLGSSLDSVTAVTQTMERDLKTTHTRPAVLQQLEWQPRYMTGRPVSGRESIDRLLFDFVDNRLFKMSITYARERTNGLTNADMIDSLIAVYGTPSAPSARPSRSRVDYSLNSPDVVAEWRQADTTVVLQRGTYNESFVLVITSVSLDATARKAQATAVVMDALEAPARDAAREKQRVDDARQAEEIARAANKKDFRP